MTHPELFEVAETLSPLEAWKRRHGITVRAAMMDGRAIFIASVASGGNRRGNTQEDALIALAEHLQIHGWMEEAYLPPQEGEAGLICPGRRFAMGGHEYVVTELDGEWVWFRDANMTDRALRVVDVVQRLDVQWLNGRPEKEATV